MKAKDNSQENALKKIAVKENLDFQTLKMNFLAGSVVYLKNRQRQIEPVGIGKNLPTRVNVNLGTSGDLNCIEDEFLKLEVCEKYGADAVMDLSTAGDLKKIRQEILKRSSIPLGTVPIYEAYLKAQKKYGDFALMQAAEMLDIVAGQADEGVDFMTVHAGVTLETVRKLELKRRLLGIVSRGGSFLSYWMSKNNAENPFLTHFDELLEIMAGRNVVLSLGDGLRPGCIFDATDRSQISELLLMGELRDRAIGKGVQVMIEGPGHVPRSEIKANMELEKKLCGGAPFYVLGPIPADVAPGYDHICAAVGGALAAAAGADFLCCVTPAEHLRLPDLGDIREGLMAARIAAQIGDLEKGVRKAWDRNLMMDQARAAFDWKKQEKFALDPVKFRDYRESVQLADRETCSMCGELCALKIYGKSGGTKNKI
ncbi:MAG: phosphomethylpyrimidine synthase ThiC [Candidatus Wallbacteria bacterium]|nr:phosphomethylpyrimidine synthase ThiC [Candidatus Wallbacteria bacterium]